jgi:hypothetical protein
VRILEGLMGRREPVAEYRTVDGGHPAPFPDMTDEQLYNYELAFDVARRTFLLPPSAHRSETVPRPEPLLRDNGQRLRRNKVFDAPRYTMRRTQPSHREGADNRNLPPLDFSKPMRLITSKQPVEIITTRARHPVYKVHAYIGEDDVVTVFTLQGQLSQSGPRFLENAPLPHQLHLNVYLAESPGSGERYRITQHDSRVAADGAAEAGRLACVAVPFDPETSARPESRSSNCPSS